MTTMTKSVSHPNVVCVSLDSAYDLPRCVRQSGEATVLHPATCRINFTQSQRPEETYCWWMRLKSKTASVTSAANSSYAAPEYWKPLDLHSQFQLITQLPLPDLGELVQQSPPSLEC